MEATQVKYVLDSSVVIKWFSDEKDTGKALQLRESVLQGKCAISVPDLQIYEIANALRYNKQLMQEDIVQAIESLFDMNIHIILPTRKVMLTAIQMAIQYTISVYDAYFIALAETFGFVFITADEKLYEKTKEKIFVRLLHNI
jgi:predicted nucleic acid-binding protein